MIISIFVLMIYLFICRDLMMEFYGKIMVLGSTLFELLSEALGLDPSHLLKLRCVEGVFVQGNYYPPCPEPELTLGTPKHMDPTFITILLPDNLGGLQVLHKDEWSDVPPWHGALVVNIGDLLQVSVDIEIKCILLYSFSIEAWTKINQSSCIVK
jgi:isopenicillin N synthase-like dioxygenase